MVDYLRITSLAAQRVEKDLAHWQVSHDFIELGDQWTATRKVRIFRSGPPLKGMFGDIGSAAYFPDGLDGQPPPPGHGCEDRYDGFWNESLDETWSRISREEFESEFLNPSVLDRKSPLTATEMQREAAVNAIYSHHKLEPSERLPGLPSDCFSEHSDGRILRRAERYRSGLLLRDDLYIQRRREFSFVYFNGSLAEGDATPRFDGVSTTEIERADFEALYEAGRPKFDDINFLEEPPHE